MQDTTTIFENEIRNLLSEYLVEDEYRKIFIETSQHAIGRSDISARISDLYKKQLDIRIDESSDRIQIDRAITLAEKKLESNKFYEFILELGNICTASGKVNFAQEIFNKINRKTNNKSLKAKSLIGLADIYSRRANWIRGISLVTEAESIYKENDDRIGLANCFNVLGSISGEMGEIERAKNYFSQSLVFANESSDQELNAKIETNLGIINTILGNYDESVIHYESAMMIYKQIGDLRRVAEVYLNIGLNFLDTRDIKSSLAAIDKGIEISIENSYLGVLTILYHAKSQTLIADKDIQSAKEFSDKSLSLSHNLDDKLTIAEIYKLRGIIAKEMNDIKTSENYLMISLRINTSLRNSLNIAEVSIELATLYKDQGKYEQSKYYYNQAIDYFRKSNAPDKVMKIEKMLGIDSINISAAEVPNE
jgi:tetratricopeptide (TPR) repeat protein